MMRTRIAAFLGIRHLTRSRTDADEIFARRPVIFSAFAVFDAFLIALTIFFFLRSHGTTSYFNIKVPMDEQINSTMIGHVTPSYPKRVRLTFRPRESASVLYVVWNYKTMDGDWEALRISSLPDRPSTWIVVRGGRIVENVPVPCATGQTEREWNFTFLLGRIQGYENGAPVLDEPFEPRAPTVHLALTPAYVFRTLRPPWTALRSFEAEYHDRNGDKIEDATAPAWWWALVALVVAWAGARIFLATDRALCRRLVGRGLSGRLLSGYPMTTVLATLAILLFFGMWETNKRVEGGINWYQPFLKGGAFDSAAFSADPVLRRGGKEIRVALDPAVVTITAHGGSTTDGYPYPRGRWDWPTRLREKIEADPDYADHAVRVLNLSFVSDVLENNFPPGIEGFYALVKPRVAIIHPIVNNYYSYRPSEAVAHGFGQWSHRYSRPTTEEGGDPLPRFIEVARRALRRCKDAGAWPVVVIPALDPDAFPGSSPTDEWSDAAIALAREEDAGIVDLRPAFRARADAGQILFQEFMHPNRAGYELAADEIWRVLRVNRERWWPTGEITSSKPELSD